MRIRVADFPGCKPVRAEPGASVPGSPVSGVGGQKGRAPNFYWCPRAT
ncbi:MAG: hypothetical protein ACI8W8_005166, partial [Rhodothermales bacterium]